ncbi:hypothetical protein BT96DRAFT_510727 [Gymnopus androsaceus JB14]|uniref:Uncharacterized protein n=1 Tax=Gymnopus androsaceus JB14 TaxID=1447944 RepID=A0A6A4HYY4_9AGAR|nr:hypothetical protein BT96DRAFT_510727 [Gymnopus androsaceus JB14]
MHTYIQQRSTTFRTYTGSGQNQQYPPTPILSGSYFSPNPLNAQLPGFQGGLQSSLSLSQSLPGTFLVSPSSVTSPQGHYGSPSSYTDIPPCFGSPGISSKKQQWIQQSTKNTRMIQSGQFQPSAIAWIFVSNADVFPPNAINFGNESNQSFFICRSFYENQLRVGKVFLTHEGLRAFVICKGKESQVRRIYPENEN